ncbi:integrase/recombinase XerC [Muriicola jejuensis]|uniref:Tyrosine recombinase XerC n=1 Tax=Muriicola jejuensis TaxID=504488 RepID=A0A6P0U9F7_9FLAO|nr:tyrosine-type recombinase/integrase [Muriicola jejuensis]NER09202.1 tyrosine-type recombinase/integrase [Muriicola jejuensis]SMP10332.1 integrase/recombinase XerC [Muriicola jejuensis]
MGFDAFISYLSLEKKYSPHTVKAYRKDLEEFRDFHLSRGGDTGIDQANYGEIREWIVDLVEQGISNRSVNRKVTALKSYYKFLLKVGDIPANPLARHKALKTPKKVEIPFSQAEMNELLNSISFEDNFEGLRDRLIIELFYATGIRRSELINLEMADLDLPNRTIKVLGKRNKERIIPLLAGMVHLFEAYLTLRDEQTGAGETKAVFLTSRGNKIYETLVYRIINGYFSKVSSKVKKSPHILRHTFATHMLSQGADLNSVKELLGHSSLASTQVYTHNSIAELKKVHSRAHPRNRK